MQELDACHPVDHATKGLGGFPSPETSKYVFSTRSRLEQLQSMAQMPDVAIPEHHEPIAGNSIPLANLRVRDA
jgi:hypothetical protein